MDPVYLHSTRSPGKYTLVREVGSLEPLHFGHKETSAVIGDLDVDLCMYTKGRLQIVAYCQVVFPGAPSFMPSKKIDSNKSQSELSRTLAVKDVFVHRSGHLEPYLNNAYSSLAAWSTLFLEQSLRV